MAIKENVEHIKNKINKSLEGTQKNLRDITIIAVSKNVNVDKVLEAFDCGLRNFGENRVQEFLDKHEKIDKEVKENIKRIYQFKTLNIKGFMTVAPYYDNPEDARPIFKELKNNFDKFSNMEYDNVSMEYLSMGMSNDYHIAIEEGANIVRIGTELFGERQY